MKGFVQVSQFPGENTRQPMAVLTALTVLALLVAPDLVMSAETESLLQVRHTPLACVTTSSTPNVTAGVAPEAEYALSYVYFRATGEPDFYYAIMDGLPAALAAGLPRPLPGTKSIDYFVQAADRSQLTRRTPDYKPPVTDDKICLVSKKAVPAGGAGLTIGLTREGQNPIPTGFNKADIAKVILVTGAVVGVTAALSAFSGAGAGGAAAGAGAGASAGGAAGGTAAGAGGAAGAGAGAGAGAAAGGAAGAGAAAGAAVGAGAAAAAGGISTLAIVGIGVGVAAGVAVAAGSSGGESSTPAPPDITGVAVTATSTGSGSLTFNFSANVSGGTAPYSYAWDFGDNTTLPSSSTNTATHAYTKSGTYTVRCTVGDSKGKSGSGTASATVTGLQFVVATATWSGSGTIVLSILKGGSTLQTSSQNCVSQGSRSTTATVQGSQLTTGSYTVTASALSCVSISGPTSITAVFTVVSSDGTTTGPVSTCNNVFKDIPVGAAAQQVCAFNVP